MTPAQAFMGAYAPADLGLMGILSVGLLAVLAVGYGLHRVAAKAPWIARVASWALVASGFVGYGVLCAQEPPGVRMLLIIGVVLYAMKAVVATEEVITSELRMTPLEWAAWAGGWPGMDPWLFAGWRARERADRREDVQEAMGFASRGVVRLAIGAALMVGAHAAHRATGSLVLTTALALPGISLVLHFGIFNLTCAFWRALGVHVYPLFVAPLASFHLKEFWGRRWNLPFTEMIQRAVFRPLRGRVGAAWAAVAGFVFSGVLHECAISVPVQEGYGLPMLYFAVHGILVTVERRTGLDDALERRPILARAWTLFWLAAPMSILFHPPFLRGIVWPLVGVHVPS